MRRTPASLGWMPSAWYSSSWPARALWRSITASLLRFATRLISGIISSVTQTIDTFVYNSMTSNVGMSAAASFFQSVGGFVLILLFNALARRVSRENALF